MPDSTNSRQTIKAAALKLFSERDVDDVPVRQILTAAAGHRNISAISYYFTSKSALIEELLTDGANLVNERLIAGLTALEARGQAGDLRELISVMVTSFSMAGENEESAHYQRFFNRFALRHQHAWRKIVDKSLDSGYRRLLAHIRDILDQLPPIVLNQRMLFLLLMIGTCLSLREEAQDIADPTEIYAANVWASPLALDNLVDSAVGILSADVSRQAKSVLSRSDLSRREAAPAVSADD